ncbi:DUF7009 family protein [Echinicola vietnamensis]|uniref:Uncharacterized protein n=1 Tax=Echinicola vietnamensis (strain DSM 17526 / LMG 23754 / KMM 6221) TaxID=926556 RepID=L0FZW1_ECHVK|nr:hypothetical protein [Echinicola vietnamensis]AGA78165.1 hypothetical protein Echvi_1910 [Echinicola vietnamensis DSM 17526]
MKLRINNNAVRLRLTQTEVQQVAAGKSVSEHLYLGSKEMGLAYSLVVDREASEVKALFKNNHLNVIIPETLALDWASTDEVSIKHVQHQGEPYENILLIEKDFQCLHKRPDEDESDNFPNPKSLEDYKNC